MAPRKKSPESEIEATEPVATEPVAMSRRPRNEITVEPRIKFSTWFMVKSQDDQRLKPHHLETLRAFMSGHGLAAEEPARRYEAALRSYFGA